MIFLEYPITQPIRLTRFWKVIVSIGAIVWVVLITLVNVAAVGYELVPLTSISFQTSYELWYERIIPRSLIPRSRTCDGSIIKIMESMCLFGAGTKRRRFDRCQGLFHLHVIHVH